MSPRLGSSNIVDVEAQVWNLVPSPWKESQGRCRLSGTRAGTGSSWHLKNTYFLQVVKKTERFSNFLRSFREQKNKCFQSHCINQEEHFFFFFKILRLIKFIFGLTASGIQTTSFSDTTHLRTSFIRLRLCVLLDSQSCRKLSVANAEINTTSISV